MKKSFNILLGRISTKKSNLKLKTIDEISFMVNQKPAFRLAGHRKQCQNHYTKLLWLHPHPRLTATVGYLLDHLIQFTLSDLKKIYDQCLSYDEHIRLVA